MKWINSTILLIIKVWRFYPASRIILIFLFIALIHPFIANERPLYCKIGGNHYFPVTKHLVTEWGLGKWYTDIDNFGWKEKAYELKIMPLIPYSYNTIDARNPNYRGPFSDQNVDNLWQRHWFGTDALGRDVLAGILKGTEISVKVGFVSVFIACIIALVLGLGSAFTVRFPVRMHLVSWILLIMAIISNIYFLWLGIHTQMNIFFVQFVAWIILGILTNRILNKFELNSKLSFIFPFDKILMRILEAMKAIPTLILILACLTLFKKFSVNGLITLLGLIMWPSFTRYIRADALKILNMDYITAAKGYGASNFRILWKHVSPKIFSSLSVLIVFAVASAIIVESTLSFLGIGLPIEQVSWGSLLKEAKLNFNAWWLAIFPGFALFVLIIALNLLGEQFQKRKKMN